MKKMIERFLLTSCFGATILYMNLKGYLSDNKFATPEINSLLSNLLAAVVMYTVMVILVLYSNSERKENNFLLAGYFLILAQIFLVLGLFADKIPFVTHLALYLALGTIIFATVLLLNGLFDNGERLSGMSFKEQISGYFRRVKEENAEIADRAFFSLLGLFIFDFVIYRHSVLRDFMTMTISDPLKIGYWSVVIGTAIQFIVLAILIYRVTRGYNATKFLEYVVAGSCGILWGSKAFEYNFYEYGSLDDQRIHILWITFFLFTLLLSFFAIRKSPV